MTKLHELYSILDAELQNNVALLEEAEKIGDDLSIAELHGSCGTLQSTLDIIVKLLNDDK